MSSPLDPVDALRLAQGTRGSLARDLYLPAWYAPLYGLGTGGMIAAQALPTHGAAMIGSVASLLFTTALYAAWSRRAGVRVSGYRPGPTLPITIGMAIAIVALVFVAIHQRWSEGDTVAPLICGGIAAVIAAGASRWFDHVWQREMATLR